MIMNKMISKEYTVFMFCISTGIFLRFFVMSLGHNYDWESYCIVGEISANFKNVYAETSRYNYGMIFFCIQGLLYSISRIRPEYYELIYRILMVSTLTLADLGITYYIAKKYSLKKALIFFLNPVSVIITGYHNQFDNIAVLSALQMGVFYNEEDAFNKNDICFIAAFTLSLMIKHILFILPFFLLLRRTLNWKKRIIYAFVSPFLFLVSFIPFALQSQAALWGIVNNVFLYRSKNNAPLLAPIYNLMDFPSDWKIFVYISLMIIIAFITRKYIFEKQLLLYLIAMVTFSSAIANQYLVIPMAALVILNANWIRYFYMIIAGVFLILQGSGLGVLNEIKEISPGFVKNILNCFVKYGNSFAVWILFLALIYELQRNRHSCVQDAITDKPLG